MAVAADGDDGSRDGAGPAVQVERVYVHRGQLVGFRRRANGQLVAVAGATTRPLVVGERYCWHRRTGEPRPASHADLGPLLVPAVVVLAVAGVVAGLIAIDHNDRHAHLGNGTLDLVGGVIGGGDGGNSD